LSIQNVRVRASFPSFGAVAVVFRVTRRHVTVLLLVHPSFYLDFVWFIVSLSSNKQSEQSENSPEAVL
jgi:hypothetical protein